MKHRVKKIKFKQGKDANKMLLRKLAVNFLTKGKITTTKSKARSLISFLERIITKSKQETEANKNFLFKKFGDRKIVKLLFKEIGLAVKGKSSGYLKQTFLGKRISDGTEMVKIDWTVPVVLEKKLKEKKPKSTIKPESKIK